MLIELKFIFEESKEGERNKKKFNRQKGNKWNISIRREN
jgi:hypothetical protein